MNKQMRQNWGGGWHISEMVMELVLSSPVGEVWTDVGAAF